MAKANGYIITKQLFKQKKQGDNFKVSLDIHYQNNLLAFGYGPFIKLISINTESSFWFEQKKTLVRQSIYCQHQNTKINIPNNQRQIRDLVWNLNPQSKNYLGIAIGQSSVIYDIEDLMNPKGFYKVFQTKQIMRQGDFPSKFIWIPNSHQQFLCTSSNSNQIVHRDLRSPKIVNIFNGTNLDDKTQDLKFNPIYSNIFATISKHSTIQIFDRRKSNNSVYKKQQQRDQHFQSNLLDWQYNGNRLATVYGRFMQIWGFTGNTLTTKQHQVFEHKNMISNFKWLKKHSQYLLISQLQQNIVYGYKINKQKHDLQILVNPKHSGLKKFITDKNQQIIFGLTNFDDLKKHQHQMIALFIDYQSSKSIWSKNKFIKPNNFGVDNQLLFSATKKDHMGIASTCYALHYQSIQSSSHKITKQLNITQKQSITDKTKPDKQDRLLTKKYKQHLKKQRKQLQKQIKQKNVLINQGKSLKKLQSPSSDKSSQKPLSQSKAPIFNKPITNPDKYPKKTTKSLNKHLNKSAIYNKFNQSFSQSSQQSLELNSQKNQWIISYKQQIQYLDQHYRIQINDQIPSKRGQIVCQHNSKVARSIGKHRCAQFWQYIYNLAFPQPEQKHTLSSLYQDKIKLDIFFKQHKVIANCQNKSQIMKKVTKYNIQKIIQNLVDQNQLQTAVIACIMIRNKDQKLLSIQFIQPFLICYKQLLKILGLTFISTNLSVISKFNQAVNSTFFRYDIIIGCGQCYKKIHGDQFKKCQCLQVCVFCGQPLRDRLVIGCKICGHMAHAWQYQKWFFDQKQQKCKYRQCQHKCFKV